MLIFQGVPVGSRFVFPRFSLPEFAQVYQLQPPDPTAPKSWSQSRGMFLVACFFLGGTFFVGEVQLVVPLFFKSDILVQKGNTEKRITPEAKESRRCEW